MLVDWISARNGRFREAVAAFLKDSSWPITEVRCTTRRYPVRPGPEWLQSAVSPRCSTVPKVLATAGLHPTLSRWRGGGGTKLSRWHGRGNTWRQSPALTIFRRRKAICVCSQLPEQLPLQTQIAFLRRKMAEAGL